MEFALKVSHLHKRYEKEDVLSDLSVEIPSGQIFGLIGPNGAGKSTLIGVLTGLLSYEKGDIEILGIPLSAKNERRIKQKVASVLQPPLLFEQFTGLEFLEYIAEIYHPEQEKEELKTQISSLLHFFELAEFEHIRLSALSSGNRKKVAFCGAVLANPSLLFLDEPFEAVDVISIQRMKTIIRKLKNKGCTIFITSHILEVVESLCDDIAILNKGKIIAYLDEKNRAELQQHKTLHQIFEQYVPVENRDNVLDWL